MENKMENKKELKKDLEEIKVKKSKYERVLKLSNDEMIARAIQDVLKREK